MPQHHSFLVFWSYILGHHLDGLIWVGETQTIQAFYVEKRIPSFHLGITISFLVLGFWCSKPFYWLTLWCYQRHFSAQPWQVLFLIWFWYLVLHSLIEPLSSFSCPLSSLVIPFGEFPSSCYRLGWGLSSILYLDWNSLWIFKLDSVAPSLGFTFSGLDLSQQKHTW